MVTAEMVKNLRIQTGAGLMDCKEALTASDGRMDDAVTWIRKKNLDRGSAQNKFPEEGRIAVRDDGGSVTMVEMSANTDFVANSDDFKYCLALAASTAHEGKIDSIDALNAAPAGQGSTLGDKVKELAGRLGENITITQMARYDGPCGYYLHNDNKQAAIVEIDGAVDGLAQKIGKDIAMHVVFAKPKYLTRGEIPAHLVASEEALLTEMANAPKIGPGVALTQPPSRPKPADVVAKIVQGKMNTFFGKFALLDQPYYRDQKQSVSQVLKALGEVKIKRFTRFEVGSIMQ